MTDTKRDRFAKAQARALSRNPAFQTMLEGMVMQETARLLFTYLIRKPGRKVIIESTGVKGEFEFEFLEPDGSKANPNG